MLQKRNRGCDAGLKVSNNYTGSTARLVKKGKRTEQDMYNTIDTVRDSITGDRKKFKDNVKKSEKFANANYKIDAIDRHNRRHPDAKLESVVDLVEILQ